MRWRLTAIAVSLSPALSPGPTFAQAPTVVLLRDGRGIVPSEASEDRRGFAPLALAQARRRLEERRWRVLPSSDEFDACANTECYDRATARVGATRWLAAAATGSTERCVARVVLHALDTAGSVTAKRALAPCSADALLTTAVELGRRIAEGPVWQPRPTWSATDNVLADITVFDVPNVVPYGVATATAARPVPLDDALAIYRDAHVFIIDDPNERGRAYLVRGDRLVSECELRTLAQIPPELYRPHPCDDPPCEQGEAVVVTIAPPPPRVARFCEDNDWEWAWLGTPIGGLGMIGAFRPLQEGKIEGIAFFSLGLITAVTAAALAIGLDSDAPDPRSGRHASSRANLEALVTEHNRGLRIALGLSVADVHGAGLRQ